MKTIFTLTALLFTLLTHAQPADSSNTTTKLYEGTILTLQIMQNVSSKSADVGDLIQFETIEPVTVSGRILIPIGCKVTGKVTDSQKAKGLGKAGKLNFSIDYCYLPDGKVIKLSSEQSEAGKKKLGAAVAQAVILTPLFLFKKGKQAKLEKGDKFNAYVSQDYDF